MKKVIICFSATGNSLYIAKKFEDFEIIRIKEGKEITLPENIEILGFVLPAHTFNIPYLVRKFIDEVLSSYNLSSIQYVFGIVTAGASGRLTELYLSKALEDIGLVLSYSTTIKMPDSYLNLQKEAVTDEKRDELFKEANEKLIGIKEDIKNEVMNLTRHGFFFSFISRIKSAKPKKNSKLTITSSCIKCRKCERICPEGNIEFDGEKMIMHDNCISCYACYHNCPSSAIKFPGAFGQYKSPVDLEE